MQDEQPLAAIESAVADLMVAFDVSVPPVPVETISKWYSVACMRLLSVILCVVDARSVIGVDEP